MTKRWPRSSPMRSSTIRPTTSDALPAAKGMMTRIERSGYLSCLSWAVAGVAAADIARQAIIAARLNGIDVIMNVSLSLYADILDVVGVLIAHRESARRIC